MANDITDMIYNHSKLSENLNSNVKSMMCIEHKHKHKHNDIRCSLTELIKLDIENLKLISEKIKCSLDSNE